RTEGNARRQGSERLDVVQNGIIENFRELREELEKAGAKFGSETDTEVVAHLVTREMKNGRSPADAVAAALPRLRGAFALAFLFAGETDLLIGARKGSPLAIGYGDGEMYLGSDAIALALFTDSISYLSDGDSAELRARAPKFMTLKAAKSNGLCSDRRPRLCSSTRAIIATSWPRRFTSSRRSSATRSRIISIWRPNACGCRLSCRSTFARSSASRCLPAARPITPAWWQNTGSSALRACRSRSMSLPSSAIATCLCRQGRRSFFVS